MRILFVSRWFPYPPNNGSKIRIYNVLKQLSCRHEIALLAFSDEAGQVDDAGLSAMGQYCSSVRVLPYRPFRPTSLRSLLGTLSRHPRSLVDSFDEAVSGAVAEEGRQRRCDAVVASQLWMAPSAWSLPELPAFLEELELSPFEDMVTGRAPQPPLTRGLRWLTWLKLKAYVRRMLPRFAGCTVVSRQEERILRGLAPEYSNVKVVPNGISLDGRARGYPPPEPDSLVFAGALSFSANYDAARHFVRDIFPMVRDVVPAATLRVTGSTRGLDLSPFEGQPHLLFTGYLEDVRPAVAQSWLSVAPIRLGGGTRLKILESMALGTPVVATPKGAEGLELAEGEEIFIAGDPASFAQRVVQLLQSPLLRARLAAAGRRSVERRYDWRIIGPELCGFLEESIGRWRSPSPAAVRR